MRIEKLDEGSRKNLLEALLKRSPNSYGEYEERVQKILNKVKEKKDEALFAYTEQFDGFALNAENIRVTKEEIEEAYELVDANLITIIRNILEPKIIGNRIGLHPLVTLVFMYLGLHIMGIFGMFLFPLTLILIKELQDRGLIKIWNSGSRQISKAAGKFSGGLFFFQCRLRVKMSLCSRSCSTVSIPSRCRSSIT